MVKSNKQSVNNAAAQKGASDSNRELNKIYYNDGSSLIGEDGSYFVCGICDLEGGLMCCDTCPRAFHFKCLGLEGVPDGDWKCSECVKEENLANEAAQSPAAKDPPAHMLNPLFALAEAGGQIERPLSSDTNSPSKQKQEGEAEEGQQGTVSQLPVVANDAVLLPRDNREKDVYRKWDSGTTSGSARKDKYARHCFKQELKISKKSTGNLTGEMSGHKLIPPTINWRQVRAPRVVQKTNGSGLLMVNARVEMKMEDRSEETDTDTDTDSDNPFVVRHRVTDISSEGTLSE